MKTSLVNSIFAWLGFIITILSVILFGYGLYIIYQPLVILYISYLLFRLGGVFINDSNKL